MGFEVSCSDLGIHDCDWVATGETAGEVVEQVVRNVRKEQKIRMPDAEAILSGDAYDSPLDESLDPAVTTIIRRLREELNLQNRGDDTDIGFGGVRAKSP